MNKRNTDLFGYILGVFFDERANSDLKTLLQENACTKSNHVRKENSDNLTAQANYVLE